MRRAQLLDYIELAVLADTNSINEVNSLFHKTSSITRNDENTYMSQSDRSNCPRTDC